MFSMPDSTRIPPNTNKGLNLLMTTLFLFLNIVDKRDREKERVLLLFLWIFFLEERIGVDSGLTIKEGRVHLMIPCMGKIRNVVCRTPI